jgi:hypothetical protein
MVRATLEGRKTVTRRIVTRLDGFGPVTEFGKSDTPGYAWHFRDRRALWNDISAPRLPNLCPIAKVGDRLYVRETFTLEHCVEGEDPPFADRRPVKGRDIDDVDGVTPLWVQPHYRATDPAPDLSCDRPGCAQCRDHDMGPHWVPSIHMPKWAARIWLEMTAVHVERLQDITTEQIIAEGVTSQLREHDAVVDLRQQFEDLWDGLAKPGTRWADNPWVWVVEFKRVEGARA